MLSGKFHEVKGVLFDFGGTLDSDGEHWLDRFYALYEEAGLMLPHARIKDAFYEAGSSCKKNPALLRSGLRPLVDYHIRAQFSILGLDTAGAETAMARSFCSKSERFLRRNATFLNELKKCCRLGVVSNFYGNAAVVCHEAGLSDSLEVIVDSVPAGVEKPDHRIFQIALHALRLPASKVVFVGDSYNRDMVPARELGMKTVWLPGPNPRTPLLAAQTDARISSLADLAAVLA